MPILLVLLILAAYCYFVMPRNMLRAESRPRYSLSEPFSFDYNFLLRKDRARENVCVMITSDEESMLRMDFHPSIWKKQFAAALDKASQCGAKVIVTDLALNTSDDNKVIIDAFKKAGNVILGYLCKDNGLRFLDKNIISAVRAVGAADIISVRTSYINASGMKEGSARFSMPVKTAFMYKNIPLEEAKIITGEYFIAFIYKDEKISFPTIGPYGNEFLIHYLYGDTDIPVIPLWRVIEGDFDKNLFRNKIVIISSEPYSVYEKIYSTPLGNVPAGIIMANVINSIVYSNFLRPVSYELNVGIMCIASLLLALLFYENTVRNGFIALVFVVLFSVGISFWLLARNIYWSYFDIAAFSIIAYMTVQLCKKWKR